MAAERRTKTWWSATVARWRASGLTAGEFAADEGVSERTLAWWASTLRRGTRARRGSSKATPNAPIEIDMSRAAAAAARSPSLDIETGGVVVHVPVGTDVEYVRALVAALGPRS